MKQRMSLDPHCRKTSLKLPAGKGYTNKSLLTCFWVVDFFLPIYWGLPKLKQKQFDIFISKIKAEFANEQAT